MKKLGVFACVALLLAGIVARAAAQTPPSPAETTITPQAALTRLLSAPEISADWLAPSFTAQIPAARLSNDIRQYENTLGPFLRVAGSGANGVYLAMYRDGTLPALIVLDDRGRVIELLFRAPQLYSIDGALQTLRTLPGQIGFVVLENGRTIASDGSDRELAVGSPRLPVLDALAAEVAKGRYRWSDVVKLTPAARSLPPGVLQDWPAGSAVTIETLASLMFSIGDNTAADELIRTIGRDAIAPFAGSNVPFLTTREMFTLKSKQNAPLLDQWRSGSAAQRSTIAQLDRLPLPAIADLDTASTNVDVDWRYTSRRLCEMMARVSTLPSAGIDPGFADPSEWEHVAYAGGYDWGAVSATSWLVAKDGRTFCVSATWNESDRAIDRDTFDDAYLVLLNSVRNSK